jgi:hypothetical protein
MTAAYLGKDVFVEMRLQSGHLYSQYTFALGRERREDVAFQSPQHELLELLMQLLDLRLMVSIVQVEFVRQCD